MQIEKWIIVKNDKHRFFPDEAIPVEIAIINNEESFNRLKDFLKENNLNAYLLDYYKNYFENRFILKELPVIDFTDTN